ncbi:hypothetical protein CK216_22880 [Mesorhizobium sp. WSM3876]|nr:hypothetical protein CK216_22880 [Mesorhizobium sp. WSM3876]
MTADEEPATGQIDVDLPQTGTSASHMTEKRDTSAASLSAAADHAPWQANPEGATDKLKVTGSAAGD